MSQFLSQEIKTKIDRKRKSRDNDSIGRLLEYQLLNNLEILLSEKDRTTQRVIGCYYERFKRRYVSIYNQAPCSRDNCTYMKNNIGCTYYHPNDEWDRTSIDYEKYDPKFEAYCNVVEVISGNRYLFPYETNPLYRWPRKYMARVFTLRNLYDRVQNADYRGVFEDIYYNSKHKDSAKPCEKKARHEDPLDKEDSFITRNNIIDIIDCNGVGSFVEALKNMGIEITKKNGQAFLVQKSHNLQL